MTLGLVGRKCGMTRVFTDDGLSIPVTVIEVKPNKITQIKTVASDGYEAIQVTKGHQKTSRLNRAQIGHLMKAGVDSGTGYWEFRTNGLNMGSQLVSDVADLDGYVIGKTDNLEVALIKDNKEIRNWNDLNKNFKNISKNLKKLNIKSKDRIAAYMPNIPETVEAFLGSVAIGAIWSSCSPDFGINGVIERFSQIKPKILIVTDQYFYNGKKLIF